jgi:hypothetical protein
MKIARQHRNPDHFSDKELKSTLQLPRHKGASSDPVGYRTPHQPYRFQPETRQPAEDAEEVLKKPALKELEVEAKDGHWYSMRILPYRTADNVIDGVVVSFLDIHDRKTASAKSNRRTSLSGSS